jgi:hypothetical protein
MVSSVGQWLFGGCSYLRVESFISIWYRKRGGGARTARSNEVVWRGWGQRRGREGSRRAGRAGIRNVEESDTGRERPTHPISLKKWILLLGRKSAAAIECTGASPQR